MDERIQKVIYVYIAIFILELIHIVYKEYIKEEEEEIYMYQLNFFDENFDILINDMYKDTVYFDLFIFDTVLNYSMSNKELKTYINKYKIN